MGNLIVELPPPAHWQDFELLSLDVFRNYWKDDYAERHGRSGQAQHGVDIRGYSRMSKHHVGVQCKKKMTTSGDERAGSTLTESEMLNEANKASAFHPKLDVFVIATTGQRDAALQDAANATNAKGVFPFKIALWFWDDYTHELNSNPELLYRYYENVLKYREEYSPEEHFLRMITMSFNRPALRTPLTLEARFTDLRTALSNTMEAIATGVLKDRDGRVIDECRRPKRWDHYLDPITRELQLASSLVSEGLARGVLIEHASCTEVRDGVLAEQVNRARRSSVDALNQLLVTEGFPALVWDGQP